MTQAASANAHVSFLKLQRFQISALLFVFLAVRFLLLTFLLRHEYSTQLLFVTPQGIRNLLCSIKNFLKLL